MSNNIGIEAYLKIFNNRSILVNTNGTEVLFMEGKTSESAKKRLKAVKKALDESFLVEIIQECQKPNVLFDELEKEHADLITNLVDSVTSEVGRALVGITILQLTIKAICPEQNIRLHKGSNSSNHFSWEEGIPMRVIDKNFITPVLRHYDLLRLNADGIMMTRSLAENYPYTPLYKAALRGAKEEWLKIANLTEKNIIPPKAALSYLIACLINRSKTFETLASQCLENVKKFLKTSPSPEKVLRKINFFIENSSYSARVFEVSLHGIFQVLEELRILEGSLKPLCQMRSANKKHGNIGDIEILEKEGTLQILESWDAKYGKPYLRDELEEINEKLEEHPETQIVGFVVDSEPDLRKEIIERTQEIEILRQVKIIIIYFEEFVEMQQERSQCPKEEFYKKWLWAITESLCQKRRDKAPIDEPCDQWVTFLNKCFS